MLDEREVRGERERDRGEIKMICAIEIEGERKSFDHFKIVGQHKEPIPSRHRPLAAHRDGRDTGRKPGRSLLNAVISFVHSARLAAVSGRSSERTASLPP